MFRLTALLCAAIFLALLIAGNDHGQTRPGLARAKANGEEIIEITRSFSPVAVMTPQQELQSPGRSNLPPPIELAPAPEIASVPRDEPPPTPAAAPIFTLSPITGEQEDRIAAANSANAALDAEAQLAAARKARDENVIGRVEPLNPPLDPNETSLYADPSDGGTIAIGADPTTADSQAAPEDPAATDPMAADPMAADPFAAAPSYDPAADPYATAAAGGSFEDAPGTPPAGGATDADIRVVDATSVNVRLSPDGEGAVIGKLFAGEMVQVLSTPDADWVEIYLESEGLRGFVAARFLTGSIY